MGFSTLFRIKRIDALISEAGKEGKSLKKTLGAFDLVSLGIGGVIGAGIFALVGTAAAGDALRPGAGPAIMLSFLLTGIACGFTAFCYAEFASMAPISGSAYTYAYSSLGEVVAWIIGWDLILEYAVGNVAVAVSWSGYLRELLHGFGLDFPAYLATDLRTAMQTPEIMEAAPRIFGVPLIFNLPAVFIVTAISVLLVVGIRESAMFNAIMVGIKLLVLGFFVIIGMFYIKPENYVPFAPNGLAGIQAGAAVIFFAFIGFDAVSTTAEECKNPKRDLPIGIIGTLAVCTVIYIVVAAVLTGMVPWYELNTAEPLSVAMREVDLGWAAGIVAFGSIIAHTAVLLVFQMGQPRILFSMSRDGLLPKTFSKVHKRYKTPWIATILTGLFVGIGSAIASLDEMADLCNIGTLSAFMIVCAGVIVLRYKDPDRPRGFRTPWVPWFPLMGIAACLYLMLGLPATAWIRFGFWLAAGIILYFIYGYRKSRLREEAKE